MNMPYMDRECGYVIRYIIRVINDKQHIIVRKCIHMIGFSLPYYTIHDGLCTIITI